MRAVPGRYLGGFPQFEQVAAPLRTGSPQFTHSIMTTLQATQIAFSSSTTTSQ
jgi:hypothetical protein